MMYRVRNLSGRSRASSMSYTAFRVRAGKLRSTLVHGETTVVLLVSMDILCRNLVDLELCSFYSVQVIVKYQRSGWHLLMSGELTVIVTSG